MKEYELKFLGQKIISDKNINDIEICLEECKKALLVKDIANIHNKRIKHINEIINENKLAFKNKIDIIDLKKCNFEIQQFIKLGFTNMQIAKSTNIYILSEKGYCKLLELMEDKKTELSQKIFKEYFNSKKEFIVALPRKEIIFRELLSDILNQFNIKIEYQYMILGYRIDIYIPSLNIAIEYDENNHKRYSYEEHEGRQINIEKELGCKFIRVTDEYSVGQAIGIILKELKYNN